MGGEDDLGLTAERVDGHGVLDEPSGRHDLDAACVDLTLGGDALDAAEVVDVGVGVDDSGHGLVAAVFAVQLQPGGRGLRRDQGVDGDGPFAPDVAYEDTDRTLRSTA